MRLIMIGLGLLILTGCSFAPEYQRPKLELPSVWQASSEQESLSLQWWKRFNDPALTGLVEESLQHNQDLAAALARVDYARARLGLARAELFPLISGVGVGNPLWVDSNTAQGGTAPYQANLALSWEMDLWGKLRNAKDAASFQLLGTEASLRGLQLSLAGQVANGYFLLQSAIAQKSIAESTLRSREDALKIYRARYDQGLIDELDLTRASTEVEAAKTSLYRTNVALDAAESALAVLAGRSPNLIFRERLTPGLGLDAVVTAPIIPGSLPSNLLDRRPDIVSAEYNLMATNANIGTAKAAWFPTISLTGMLGIVSPQLHSLLQRPSDTWSYGAALSVPLLDFGRVSSNVEAAEANQREAEAMYQKTVQTAFQEMRDALYKQQESRLIVESLDRMVRDLRLAAGLAKTRYDNGYSSYLEVLDAERSLFDAELELASAKSSRLSSIVAVCLALGGGWKE